MVKQHLFGIIIFCNLSAPLGMIKRCIWKGQRVNCSSIFSMHPTNRGMCCTFNKQKADEMFRANRYQKQLTKLTEQDKGNSLEDSTIPEWLVYDTIAIMVNIFLFQV